MTMKSPLTPRGDVRDRTMIGNVRDRTMIDNVRDRTMIDDLHGAALERLVDLLEPVEPPSAVWEEIKARTVPKLGEVVSVRADGETGWRLVADGIRLRLLHHDPDGGWDSYMVRMDAGARYGLHEHDADEECVVLEGRVRIDGREYGPGDYELARRGGRHELIEALVPLVMFVRGRLPPELLPEGLAA